MYTKKGFSNKLGADKPLHMRIMGVMKGTKKGFTLVEAVVTIAILGVAFSLTTFAISQLAQVQNGAAEQVSFETRYQEADSLLNEYVSFVSLKTPGEQGISFSYKNHTSEALVFTASYLSNDYNFSLSFDSTNKKLSVTSDPSVPDGYLAKTNWPKAEGISGVSFSYDSGLSFFTAEIVLDEQHSRKFAYVVRVDA